MMYIYH